MSEKMKPNWEEIYKASSEETRKKAAVEKGLPENASWTEINEDSSEETRKKAAVEKGLPENASWTEINQAK